MSSHESFVNGKREEQLISLEDVGEFYRDKVNFANATGHASFDSRCRLIEQFSIARLSGRHIASRHLHEKYAVIIQMTNHVGREKAIITSDCYRQRIEIDVAAVLLSSISRAYFS